MELEKALGILHAPNSIQESIRAEYTITSEESKNAALSELQYAQEWLNRQTKTISGDWTQMVERDKIYNEYVQDFIKSAEAEIAILKTLKEAIQGPLSFKEKKAREARLEESQKLAIVAYDVGFSRAAYASFKTSDDFRQYIVDRVTAAETIKKKIDHIKAYHGVDAKGNLVPW